VFLEVQILILPFSLTVLNFVVLFRSSNKKFNQNFKNVLKIVNFLLQVGFTDDFNPD